MGILRTGFAHSSIVCHCLLISGLSILLSDLRRRLELMTQAVMRTVNISY